MELYFAYGSNLCTRQMVARCPSARVVTRAVLPGYRVCFPRTHRNWPGGVAGLERRADASVEGVIYRISTPDLIRLDSIENVQGGSYSRQRQELVTPSGGVETAWVYMAHREDGAPFTPSRQYLETILAGAREHRLSAGHVRYLASFLGDEEADGLGRDE